MHAALIGVHTGPGSACQSSLPNASPILATAASWKGHRIPETAYEGKLILPCFAALKSNSTSPMDPAMTASSVVQDPDSSVRDTAADALGRIAEHLYRQQDVLLPGETASNPVLKAAFDTMLEHKREMQQAGTSALSQVHCLILCFFLPARHCPWSSGVLVLSSTTFTVDSRHNSSWLNVEDQGICTACTGSRLPDRKHVGARHASPLLAL